MSLSDRKPMSRCGKRYASAKAARDSKRGRTNPGMVPERCPCGGCHLACEKRGKEMRKRGLWLESWERPELVPVIYAAPEGFAELWLTEDGTLAARPPSEVAA